MTAEAGLWKRLTTPRELGGMSPLGAFLTYLALGLWSFVCLFPLYWILITSFKLPLHVNDGPVYVPFVDFTPSLHAWEYIFVDLGNDTLRPYLNSVVVALASTALALLVGSLAAYALTRVRYRVSLAAVGLFLLLLAAVVVAVVLAGVPWWLAAAVALALLIFLLRALGQRFRRHLGNEDILFWMISNRILPPVVAVLPIYMMFQKLGLLDTHLALIVTYAAVNLPIVVWLMRDFFATIPYEIEESAQIDGAGRFRIVLTIVLPLARAGLAATFLLVLILAWNEYLLALFLSTAKAQTMPLLVAGQNATRGPQWWYMSVLIVLMVAPVVVLAIALQRFIARGFLVGAVKG
jgi:multiple sugar transport system permease protein